MSEIIAIAMQKGGVGKTTTTINLASALSADGYSVLVVDLDPQGNLTEHIGIDPEDATPSIYHLFQDEIENRSADVTTALYETEEGFHILPSQPELSLVELNLINALSREHILATLLEPLKQYYDYILIDCNPSLGLLVVNALTVADGIIIPVQTEYLAARGATMILNTVSTIQRKKLNPNLQVYGILLTMADTRTIITREVMEAVTNQLGDDYYIFENVIKRSVRFAESAVNGQSVIKYAPKSDGAIAYRNVAKELANRIISMKGQ